MILPRGTDLRELAIVECIHLGKSIFDLFDPDRSGKITGDEIREFLTKVGLGESEAELDRTIRALDEDASGEVRAGVGRSGRSARGFCITRHSRDDALARGRLIFGRRQRARGHRTASGRRRRSLRRPLHPPPPWRNLR